MKLTKCIVNMSGPRLGWLIKFPYDAAFLEEFKDCIERGYREWHEASKSWWVDEMAGEWLPQLFENWEYPIVRKSATQKKCPLNKCDGTGKLPFVKDGRLILDTYIFCDCREDNPERLSQNRAKPSDFDFPMSDIFRGYSFEYSGKTDPGQSLRKDQPSGDDESDLALAFHPIPQKEIYLAKLFSHLHKDLKEHIEASKKKGDVGAF